MVYTKKVVTKKLVGILFIAHSIVKLAMLYEVQRYRYKRATKITVSNYIFVARRGTILKNTLIIDRRSYPM